VEYLGCGDLRFLEIAAHESQRLYNILLTRFKRKKIRLRPEPNTTGFDLVPNEYFFW
jgi:hypothetical protein